MAMTEFHRRFSGLGAKPLGLQVWAISMRNIFGRWLLSTHSRRRRYRIMRYEHVARRKRHAVQRCLDVSVVDFLARAPVVIRTSVESDRSSCEVSSSATCYPEVRHAVQLGGFFS